MAGHLERTLAEHGIRRIRTETSPDWVLLDAGDLVVHLFKPEARANYRLEKMWGPDSPPAGGNVMEEGDTTADSGFEAVFESSEEEEEEDDLPLLDETLNGLMDDEDDEDDEEGDTGPGRVD